jgi:hypothetical protein
MMLLTDVAVRQREYEQRVQRVDQTYWMQTEIEPSPISVDRWQWRMMNKVGGWLVETGCRLQTHVDQARQVVRPSQMTMEANSNSTQPCP